MTVGIEKLIKECEERYDEDITEDKKNLKKIMRAVVIVYSKEEEFNPLLDWLVDTGVLAGKFSKLSEEPSLASV